MVLVLIPLYLFFYFTVKVYKKNYKEPVVISILIFLIVIVNLQAFVNYDTFRHRPLKKLIVDRIEGGQWRVLVLRENGQFEDFSEDRNNIKILGINFRESFGIGHYDRNVDQKIFIYYQKFITQLNYQPLEYETINEAVKSNIRYNEE